MSRKERLELIQEIEAKRKSKVIAYITSDRPGLSGMLGMDAIPVIENHVEKIIAENPASIDLFLYSRGGDTNLPWSLVSMFREFLGDAAFNVLIPFRAHSAATVVSLGADEIVMTRMAELGPIDATIQSGPYNPKEPGSNQRLPISVEDARGYFQLLMDLVGLKDPEHKMAAFERLSRQVHPLALGSVNRILTLTQQVVEQLLQSRKKKLGDAENKKILKRLIFRDYEPFSHDTPQRGTGVGPVIRQAGPRL